MKFIDKFCLNLILISFSCLNASSQNTNWINYYSFDVSNTKLEINNQTKVFKFNFYDNETVGKFYYDSSLAEYILTDTVFNYMDFQICILEKKKVIEMLDTMEFILKSDWQTTHNFKTCLLKVSYDKGVYSKVVDYENTEGLGYVKIPSSSNDTIFFEYPNLGLKTQKIGLVSLGDFNKIKLDFSEKIIKSISVGENNHVLKNGRFNRLTIRFYFNGTLIEKKLYVRKKDLLNDVNASLQHFKKYGRWIW